MSNTDNKTYTISTPEHITNGANVLIYCPGAGNLDPKRVTMYQESHPNDIVILNSTSVADIDGIVSELNTIKDTYNISYGNIDVYSHSRGDASVFYVAKGINDGGLSATNIVILDTSHLLGTRAVDSAYKGINITPEIAQSYADNGTNVIIASQYRVRDLNASNINSLIEAQVPIYHIEYPGGATTECINPYVHELIERDLINCGLIDVLFRRTDALEKTKETNRHISYYNYDTNTWENEIGDEKFVELVSQERKNIFERIDTNYSYLKDLTAIDSSFLESLGYNSAITSDQQVAINYMNTIRNDIKATNALGNLSQLMTGVGDNNVLELEAAIIAKYFNATEMLLEKISKETESVVSIAAAIDNCDTNIAEYATILNKNEAEISIQDIVGYKSGNIETTTPTINTNNDHFQGN